MGAGARVIGLSLASGLAVLAVLSHFTSSQPKHSASKVRQTRSRADLLVDVLDTAEQTLPRPRGTSATVAPPDDANPGVSGLQSRVSTSVGTTIPETRSSSPATTSAIATEVSTPRARVAGGDNAGTGGGKGYGVASIAKNSCRGFLVVPDASVNHAVLLENHPADGYRGTPKMCCGLCQHHPWHCRAWVAEVATERCWLYAPKPGHKGIVVTRKDNGVTAVAGRVAGLHRNYMPAAVKDRPEGSAYVEIGDAAVGPITVDPTVAAAISSLPPIPHKLHIIFPNKSIVESETPMARHGVRRMIALNPEWSWRVYEDEDLRDYVRAEPSRPDPMLTPTDVELLVKGNIIELTDAARLLILWREGGFYQDADRIYNIPMSEVLTPDIKMVLPTIFPPPNFMQDVMCTAPQNPIVRRALELSNEIRRVAPRLNGSVSSPRTLEMGVTWGRAISIELFGIGMVNNLPQWEAMLEAIRKVSAIKTAVEGWCFGIWIKPYEKCKSVSRTALYKEFKMTAWAKPVDNAFRTKCDGIREEQAVWKKKNSTKEKELKIASTWFDCDHKLHKPKKA